MSADSYEELKHRLESLIQEIEGIKYDSFGCSRFDELRYLINKAKLTEEQKEKLQQIKETKEKEITPLDALYEIKKQIGNIHVFTDEIPPQQTNIELRNSGLFEIVDKELWESIKNRGWIKELLECKQKLEEELVLIKRHKVFLAFVINAENVYEYNSCVHWEDAELTESEFNLIKEWLKK